MKGANTKFYLESANQPTAASDSIRIDNASYNINNVSYNSVFTGFNDCIAESAEAAEAAARTVGRMAGRDEAVEKQPPLPSGKPPRRLIELV